LHRWSFGRVFAFVSKLTNYSNSRGISDCFFWVLPKHFFTSNSLAEPYVWGRGCQGGAQQGTGARGEQYLDGSVRSHTVRLLELFSDDDPAAAHLSPYSWIKLPIRGAASVLGRNFRSKSNT